MTKKTNVLRASLTGIAGLVGAAVAAVVVVAACFLPLPGYTAVTSPLEVTPAPAEQYRVCPGPLLQVLPQATGATAYFAAGTPTFVSDVKNGTSATRDLDATDVTASGSPTKPRVLSVPPAPEADSQPLISGVQSQNIASEDLSGLAVSDCTDVSSDAWLVGGATDVGRTTLILLSNPTEVAANVSLEIFGENGAVTAPNATGILVEPGQQRVLSLAAYAPDVTSPVVHVMSSGGQIQAALQQSTMRALIPGGVDVITASAAPSTTQIMTGVALTGLVAPTGVGGGGGADIGVVSSDVESTLRVAVPGDQDSDIVMTVIGVSGVPVELHTTVPAHHTLQMPFTGVVDGTYTVVVTGTMPVVAGVRSVQAASGATATAVTTPGTPPVAATASTTILGGDFAWHTSALALTGETLLPVAPGPTPTLSLYNPTQVPVTVTLTNPGAPDVSVLVPAGKMTTTAVVSGSRYTLGGAATLHAALTYAGPGVGASVAINPTNQRGSAIAVIPR